MGTFNYKTTEFITLAIKEYDTDDYLKDADFLEYAKGEYEIEADDTEALEDLAREQIMFNYEADYENGEVILEKYDIPNFNARIASGYYEGCQLLFDIDYDWWTEKADMLKQLDDFKKMLHELNGCGYNATVPFWIPTWHTYDDTKKMIDIAVAEIKDDIIRRYAEDDAEAV